MTEEIKKSHNPFKMWGSWVGFGVGMVSIFAYVTTPYLMMTGVMTIGSFPLENLAELASDFITINPIFWITEILYGIEGLGLMPFIVLTTPIVAFLYGWGIHLICRKLESK